MKKILLQAGMVLIAATAFLLALAGLTGSMHAYYPEIDEWLNPGFYQTTSTGTALHPADLITKLEADVPEAEVWYMQIPETPGRTVMMATSPRFNAETGTYANLINDYYYMDPVTGDIVGARDWGACCFEPENLMNYIYELHHSLTIPGNFGSIVMGIVALLWVGGCLVMLFQAALKREAITSLGLSPTAASIIAALMLPVAISSVAMNFSAEIFKPVVSVFSDVKPSVYEDYATRPDTDFGPRILSYKDAYSLASEIGKERGWQKPVGELFYSNSYNFYGMAFGTRDPSGMGNVWLYLSAVDGTIVHEKTPAAGTAGDLFSYAQLPLHSGRAFGAFSQFFIFGIGMMVTFLSLRLSVWALKKTVKPSV